MLSTILMFQILTAVLSGAYSSNPVKVMTMILIFILSTMVLMSLMGGEIWMPMILTMLFTGGILIMFMILSTFEPNMKFGKTNMSILIIMMISMIMTLFVIMESSSSYQMQIKMFYQSSASASAMTLLMILYFLIFIKIIQKEKSSMRMSICCS